MYLHLFKCAPAEIFAATPDSRGANLPTHFRGKWKYLRGATVMPGDSPSMMLDPQAVLAGVKAQGFHVWGAGLPSPEPRETPAAPVETGAAEHP
jgi:hypothetical protein